MYFNVYIFVFHFDSGLIFINSAYIPNVIIFFFSRNVLNMYSVTTASYAGITNYYFICSTTKFPM